MKGISVVIPVYNEQDNVVELYNEIRSVMAQNSINSEIIFVDDGSTDQTGKRIMQLPVVKYIRMRKNFGQTAALDAGIKEASFDFIVTMDGDRQNDPADIPRLLSHLEQNNLDVVSGWRKNRRDSFMKRFVSRVANKLRYLIIHDGIHDSGCTLKIYRRECFKQISLYGEMHRFIPAVLKIKGYCIDELVVNHRPRIAGTTKYNWRRTFKGFIDMISVWFWNKYAVKPLHLLGGLGLISIGAGVLTTLYSVYLFFRGYDMADTALPILSVFFLLTGIILFVLGLIADMLSKIYYQTTSDRSYSVKEVIEKK